MTFIIIKIGGSVLNKLSDSFYETLVKMKQETDYQPVLVHGGGPEITEALKKWEISSTFVNGLRVTTDEVLKIAEMVLSGSLNKRIVSNIQRIGGKSIGLSGIDGPLLTVSQVDPRLGFVGKVESVNPAWLHSIFGQGAIPVISPIGIDPSGQKYNINADMAAASIAIALNGKLAFISDIPGVMEETEQGSIVHPKLTKVQINRLIEKGVITGGMIPKVQSALSVLEAGVKEAVILNGSKPKDLLTYMDGLDAGTRIIREEVYNV
ncbi:acetylglutamate kinase [Salipaludibacillus keqinensis]|uniref:Acetylglutamate kinase n=1 Tax=Salipaludibacillus keqinensis TaxID=2045207 RepID=A0A323TRG6_9BACI|nr:acetylglutamate kinase [Salipaludibacillus keqinensis]PYZ95133.1 acetylglutamate kinase [Salipaludibacillus keqinensis]